MYEPDTGFPVRYNRKMQKQKIETKSLNVYLKMISVHPAVVYSVYLKLLIEEHKIDCSKCKTSILVRAG